MYYCRAYTSGSAFLFLQNEEDQISYKENNREDQNQNTSDIEMKIQILNQRIKDNKNNRCNKRKRKKEKRDSFVSFFSFFWHEQRDNTKNEQDAHKGKIKR